MSKEININSQKRRVKTYNIYILTLSGLGSRFSEIVRNIAAENGFPVHTPSYSTQAEIECV